MIVKDIIKNKPVIQLPASPVVRNIAEAFAERARQARHDGFSRMYKDQLEYNTFLDNVKYGAGDFVCNRSKTPNSIFEVYYCRHLETDYDKIKQWTGVGVPCAVHLLWLAASSKEYFGEPHYFEWHTGPGFKQLTDQQVEQVIDVHVRNYIESRATAAGLELPAR